MESNWISVKDKLPEEWEHVLICEHKCHITYAAFYIGYLDQGKWWYYDEKGEIEYDHSNADYLDITHWMPLPNPPQDFMDV